MVIPIGKQSEQADEYYIAEKTIRCNTNIIVYYITGGGRRVAFDCLSSSLSHFF